MKITVKYDRGLRKEDVVSLEIDENEFDEMIEYDYNERLSKALPNETIKKRTAQEIIDDMNRKERNSWQTHNRRKIGFTQEGNNDSLDILDYLSDESKKDEIIEKLNYEDLCHKIRKLLNPEQAQMVIAICSKEFSIKDYAKIINDSSNNVSKRLGRVRKKLRNLL